MIHYWCDLVIRKRFILFQNEQNPTRGQFTSNSYISRSYKVYDILIPCNLRPKRDIQEIHVQLQRIRKDIDDLSSKLTAEIPEGITCHGLSYFDDDSKRWFARELYSLR